MSQGVPFSRRQNEPTPAEKIKLIEAQIAACESGKQGYIDCPYCGMRTEKGETLCCMTMGKAVRAILQRQTAQELGQVAERIAENIYAGRN